tara:strand:- start:460 stop:1065 length:606 start_codon:yes stop_codon:yes gene_type:complete
MKKLLIERFQELAGIKPLYQIKKETKQLPFVLESIFDKVADIVKGKSDKEKAAIEAMKKFGIEVGKPVYQFAYLPGASGDDKALQYFPELPSEQKDKIKVPIPNGYNGPIEKDGLKKIVIQSVEEGDGGSVQVSITAGDYNFKTGKFIDDDGPKSHNINDTDEIEKDLGGSEDVNDKVYAQGLKMVPYNGSLWQEFIDSKK